MKIIYQNIKKGEVKVQVQNLDDLWYLSNLIDTDDLVKGMTERKIKIGEEGSNMRIVRKTIYLTVKAKKVEFSKYSNILRILGTITEAPEDIPKGSHQTISVEINTILTLIKEKWLNYQLDKLREASTQKDMNILFLIFDREEAIFGILKSQGYKILTKLKGDVRKKGVEEKKADTFYKEITKLLQDYANRYKLEGIIVASPSFWKEYLMKEIPKELKDKIILSSCSDVDETAINELLKRPELGEILKRDRTARENRLIEGLLEKIAKEKAAYGFKEVKEKAELGAIAELIITDTLIQKYREKEKYEQLEKVMKLADELKGKVFIISSEDAVKKLDGLGGIAAILRW